MIGWTSLSGIYLTAQFHKLLTSFLNLLKYFIVTSTTYENVQLVKDAISKNTWFAITTVSHYVKSWTFYSCVLFLLLLFFFQLCRAVYEMMQTRHADASKLVTSLDIIYDFIGENLKHFEAVEDHSAKNEDEINFSKGDLIYVTENHYNGFSKGRNIKHSKKGLFPSYKVVLKFPVQNISYSDFSDQWFTLRILLLQWKWMNEQNLFSYENKNMD